MTAAIPSRPPLGPSEGWATHRDRFTRQEAAEAAADVLLALVANDPVRFGSPLVNEVAQAWKDQR